VPTREIKPTTGSIV